MKFLSFILLFFVSFSTYSNSAYSSAYAEEKEKLRLIQEYKEKITILDIDSFLVAVQKIIMLSSSYSYVYDKNTPFHFEQMIRKKFIYFGQNNIKNVKENKFTLFNINIYIFPNRVEVSDLNENQFLTLKGELVKNEKLVFLFSKDQKNITIFFNK